MYPVDSQDSPWTRKEWPQVKVAESKVFIHTSIFWKVESFAQVSSLLSLFSYSPFGLMENIFKKHLSNFLIF